MYEEYYGFSERPFQLTPDPSFYYETVTHKKALSYLGYGLDQGEGFIVITGEVGAGKSTLVGHLRNRLDWNAVTVGEVVTSALGSDEMIGMAAHSFGLEVDARNKAGALAAIESFLQDEARAGRKVLLIVDEAQNLTIGALEELRMLSNFHLGAQPLLQMLLLGQPEFRQLLGEWDELEQLRQRVIAAHHLDAMEPQEIEPYVMHRLDHVGYRMRPEFADGIWAMIYRESRGIPRLVNRIMSRLLMKAALGERQVVDETLLDEVLGEMSGRTQDPAFQTRRPERAVSAEQQVEDRAPHQPSAQSVESPTQESLLDAQIEAIEHAFAQRDKTISNIRKDLAAMAQHPSRSTSDEVDKRLQSIETRLDDQERSLRHVLAMMIDYFESSATRDAA